MCSSSKTWILDISESMYYRIMGQDDSRSLAAISTTPAFRDSSRQTASSSKEQELLKTEVFELSDDNGVDDCCILDGSTPTFHNGSSTLFSNHQVACLPLYIRCHPVLSQGNHCFHHWWYPTWIHFNFTPTIRMFWIPLALFRGEDQL